MSDTDRVSAVIVSYAEPAATRTAVDSLRAGAVVPAEVLVVDNHPTAPLRDWVAEGVRVIHSGENLGYTAACNRAAAAARGEWLFFLNPDARADPACLRALLASARTHDAVLGAQVLLPDGRVNAGANPLHLSGISWAGRYGMARESGKPREVIAVSGAALLARRSAYAELGGLCERFFLYNDDTDLCWRARLAGWTVRFCPEAIVHHDYAFDKGASKWFWLERNRLWSLLSNYSAASLALLAPLLLATELAVTALALREHWGRELVRAWVSDLRALPELRRWRRRVQSSRRARDSALIALMSTRFETELLDSPTARRAGRLLDLYGAAVRVVLARIGR